MKLKVVIDSLEEERIEIYAHERSDLVLKIENLINNDNKNISAYFEDEIFSLQVENIHRFYVENNKLYASDESGKYRIKMRLYQVEELIGDSFIKINQSCLVNKNKIKKFSSSIGGYLLVELKNGEKDYVSRRQTKVVLERMGIKK